MLKKLDSRYTFPMAWHPRLMVRRGRGGVITSPSSHLGHALQACLAAVLFAGIAVAAFDREPLLLLACLLPGLFLRDAWAWFGATPLEREAYRAELERVARSGDGLPPDQRVIAVGSPRASALALVVFSGALLLLALTHQPLFLFAALVAASFGGAVLLDLVRQRRAMRRS